MPTDRLPAKPSAEMPEDRKCVEKAPLTPAAQRALAEAAARRAERERKSLDQPKEAACRGGLDPTRYGDWEINGLASDF